LQRHLAAGGKKRQGVAPNAGGGAEESLRSVAFRKSKRAQSKTDDESWVEGQQSNRLNNFDVGDTRTTHAVVEHMMPGEVAPTVTSGPPYSRTGAQAVAMRESGQGFWMQDDKAGPLRAEGENRPSRPSHVIGEPHIVQASELRLKGQISQQSTCPTLLANTKSGDNDPLAVHAISFQPGNLCRQAGADPSTTTFPTLKCDAGDQAPHVAQPMAVRRLTPNECLRLQGFPDNHTNIPWKGKPEGQAPDGPQYKCAGNSFAVPVVRWIGTRIAAQQ
jgi:site-specific DNA-cytosine methylase